jgi:2-desacetyl-2-hydroxyethyl bacteriochlorophyllide A dehydrogenase
MRAVRFLGAGKADVAEVSMPVVSSGRVLIKIYSSALCGSENKRYLMDPAEFKEMGGYLIPGHEMAGEIADAGDVKNFKPGDRIITQIMDGCGECPYCKDGVYQFCENLHYEGRTHAEYVSLPEKCIVKAPDDIPYDMLVLLGGDTVGVANRAISQLGIKAGQLVFVSGAGPIGLGITALLKHYGAFVVVSEPSAFRRDFIMQHANADLVFDPVKDNIKEELRSRTDGIGPEVIIECSGNPVAQLDALNLVRCRGTVMFCGENYKNLEIIPSIHIIHKEVTVKGAFYFTASDFRQIVALYRGGLDVSGLVSHKVSLKDAPYIIDQFVHGLTGKVILHPQE